MRTAIEFAQQELGIELFPRQVEALKGISEHQLSILCLGRRSGKTLLAAVYAVYDAVTLDLAEYLRPGELRYIVVVSPSFDSSRRVYQTIRQFFELPRLAPLVVGETADELKLVTGVVIKCLPCSARSTRGMPISSVIFDEAAHFVDTESGFQAGEQIYRALAPSVTQFDTYGRVILLSTPAGQRGLLWKLWNTGGEGIFKMQASTADMNPTISQRYLERERQRDPELFAQEYEASFVAGGGAFLSSQAIDNAVGIPEHSHNVRVLGIDPAFYKDNFGLAIACYDGSHFHIETVERWQPPVSYPETMAAIASICNEVKPNAVYSDQFGAAGILSTLKEKGVDVELVNWTAGNKSNYYSAFKAALNTGKLRLCNDGRLLSELRSLVATPTANGFQVEAGTGHDDLCSAAVLAFAKLEEIVGKPAATVTISPNPFFGGSLDGQKVQNSAEFIKHPLYDNAGRFLGPHANPSTTFDTCWHYKHGPGCIPCSQAVMQYRAEQRRLAREELQETDRRLAAKIFG